MKHNLGFLLIISSLWIFVPARSALSQESTKAPSQQSAKASSLTEVEQLKLDNMRKDFTIANQQVTVLKTQLQQALLAEQGTRNQFLAYVNELRQKYNAPETAFDFDAKTLQFVPKQKVESVKKP